MYLILVYAKFSNKQISRSYLATCLKTSTKESDYMTECLQAIEKFGLIKRHNKFINSHNGGRILQVIDYDLIYDTYFMTSIKILKLDNIPPKLVGFMLKLRTLCFDDTLRVRTDYNKADIAKYMGMTTQTLKRKLDALKALNLISEEEVIICSPEYFPVREDIQNKLKPEYTDQIRQILKTEDPASRIYKEFTWFCKNQIYMSKDANKIYNDILAGTLQSKTPKPEIKLQNIKF